MSDDGLATHPESARVRHTVSALALGAAPYVPRSEDRLGGARPWMRTARRERRRDQDRREVLDGVARERSRIAADVHDLIMQDLSFALAHARAIAVNPAQAADAAVVVEAGERALAGARRLLDNLAGRRCKPVVDAVHISARTAARDTPLIFDASGVPVGAQPDPSTLDALVHIAREAVTNAIKHAAPSSLEVVLARADEWCLLVRDDGCGFASAEDVGGFGLGNMRLRAEELGGRVQVRSVAGAGTTVEAVLP